MPITGYPNSADTLTTADGFAGEFRQAAYYLPQIAAIANAVPASIQGDGVSTYGLSNADLKAALNKAGLASSGYTFDWKRIWASYGTILGVLNAQIRTSIPSAWVYSSSALNYWDCHLTRINGAAGSPISGVPTAGTLTAAATAGAAIPPCSAGNAPRLIHSLVGTYDINESLPSGEATQVALTGANNSYSYQIAGTVPTGVTKVRIRRGLVGGATGTYGWLKDVAVTAGATYPAIPITEPDQLLRFDLPASSWMCAGMTAEFAAMWALSQSGQTGASGLFSSSAQFLSALVLSSYSMLSPGNVLLNPSNGFQGVGNTFASGQFGAGTVTGASTFTYTAGAIPTANNATANIQGFAGASGLQSRITTAVGAGTTFSFTYTYFDATHGWGVTQTSGTVTITHTAGTVGETITIPITAGQIVQSVTMTAKGGSAGTTGANVVEAAYPRTISGTTGSPSTWTSGVWGS